MCFAIAMGLGVGLLFFGLTSGYGEFSRDFDKRLAEYEAWEAMRRRTPPPLPKGTT
jgi:hypothetical protein